MVCVKPFKGVLYNSRAIDDLSKVVAPPYDVILPKMQKEYYRRHPNNVVRLILGKTTPNDTRTYNRYTRAKKFLDDWLKKGILIRDIEPSFFIYEQRFSLKGRARTRRLGFISLMKIERPHKSKVLPHENTFAKPKKDRFNLLKATETNLSPIFSLFEDRRSRITAILKSNTRKKPIVNIEQDGVIHRLWKLSAPRTIAKINNMMKKKEIFIADGHHRYEVALRFRAWAENKYKNTSGNKPYDYVMTYFSDLNSESLTVLSTHRVVKSLNGLGFREICGALKGYFEVSKHGDRCAMFSRIERETKGRFAFGMYYKKNGFFSLVLKDRDILERTLARRRKYRWKYLDVTVLHRLVFNRILGLKEKVVKKGNIVYTKDVDHALKLVDTGGYEAAFFLNPPKIEQIKDMARSHDKMPHKTTYFYPKPLSGLVFYKMENV